MPNENTNIGFFNSLPIPVIQKIIRETENQEIAKFAPFSLLNKGFNAIANQSYNTFYKGKPDFIKALTKRLSETDLNNDLRLALTTLKINITNTDFIAIKPAQILDKIIDACYFCNKVTTYSTAYGFMPRTDYYLDKVANELITTLLKYCTLKDYITLWQNTSWKKREQELFYLTGTALLNFSSCTTYNLPLEQKLIVKLLNTACDEYRYKKIKIIDLIDDLSNVNFATNTSRCDTSLFCYGRDLGLIDYNEKLADEAKFVFDMRGIFALYCTQQNYYWSLLSLKYRKQLIKEVLNELSIEELLQLQQEIQQRFFSSTSLSDEKKAHQKLLISIFEEAIASQRPSTNVFKLCRLV